MTEQQILNASEADFPAMCGEVLQPERTKPRWHSPSSLVDHKCSRCRQSVEKDNSLTCLGKDPIPLTPDNAFKWRDKYADDEDSLFAFIAALETVWRNGDMELCFEQWLIFAQPIHYLKAACLCKMRGEK